MQPKGLQRSAVMKPFYHLSLSAAAAVVGAACSSSAFNAPSLVALVGSPSSLSTYRPSHSLLPAHSDEESESVNENDDNRDNQRRNLLQKTLTFGALLTTPISPASAKTSKSRSDGYQFKKSEAEWSDQLSHQQYFILRQGGTEPPYSSILEGEERPGIYACAGCGTPLFDAKEKFHSGTGWPSFASPVMNNVEMEDVSTIQYQLAGAEVRCRTCGGHLGDVFADGFLFVGTPAFVTGKRYCIDGGALVFAPSDQKSAGGELEIVRGDLPPKSGDKSRVFPG